MERCTKPNNNQAAEAVFLHRVGLRQSGGALNSTGVPLLFAPMANSKRKHDAAFVTANITSEIPEEILQRKGARTTAAVPQAVRDLLNCGQIESANLCEWLIVDHGFLAQSVLPTFQWQDSLPIIHDALNQLKAPTSMKRTMAVGTVLAAFHSSSREFGDAIATLQKHASDTVRTWACAMIGQRINLTLTSKLTLLRPLAADPNMGVREIAWMAARPGIAENLTEAMQLLHSWVLDPDQRIRRFASEATRPRGVWCTHLAALKETPEQAMSLLEPLRTDPSEYVRNSVANWLNDASKSRPDFVRTTCQRWLVESPTPATKAIVKRALRTLTKKELSRQS